MSMSWQHICSMLGWTGLICVSAEVICMSLQAYKDRIRRVMERAD